MQVLEWRITALNNTTTCVSENKLSFSGTNLLARYMGGNHQNMKETEQSSSFFPKVKLSWTGSKAELIELIYAWEKAGCFNHGHAYIKEIVTYIEVVFNIDLGDYYHTFRELRRRVNRTAFLDKLIKLLNDHMDEADRKN